MKYDRIFTFGCSFTKYKWPTWSDILRYNSEIPVINCGHPGIGNVGIMHIMLEADLKYKFTDTDLIITQWSSWTREDRFLNGNWKSYGNIFSNSFYDSSFIQKYWSWENDIIKNAGAIISANKMFKIFYQFNIFPYGSVESGIDLDQTIISPTTRLFKINLPEMPVFPKEISECFEGNLVDDGHPDIKTHLYFFNNYIKDKLYWKSKSNDHELLSLQNNIISHLKNVSQKKWSSDLDELISLFNLRDNV